LDGKRLTYNKYSTRAEKEELKPPEIKRPEELDPSPPTIYLETQDRFDFLDNIPGRKITCWRTQATKYQIPSPHFRKAFYIGEVDRLAGGLGQHTLRRIDEGFKGFGCICPAGGIHDVQV
jgi:hypothetical protein